MGLIQNKNNYIIDENTILNNIVTEKEFIAINEDTPTTLSKKSTPAAIDKLTPLLYFINP